MYLANADGVAAFFLSLGYNVDMRVEQTPSALGISADSLLRQITHIERIASQNDELQVYLFEMKSMRVADRQGLARAFKNVAGQFLLVITSDYDSLDFVLMERQLPGTNGGPMSRKQVTVRPRVLTVDRHNPGPVELRVLRRFTNTEADAYDQFDKLRSAYTVAEWSEPLFNNRALFSDYYLNNRLRDTPEWQEDVRQVYQTLRNAMLDVRGRFSQADEAKTRAELLEPIMETLGFAWTVGKQSTSSVEQPDYYLYHPDAGEDDAPLAYCLAYTWNRYLDNRDETRDKDTPEENPGAQVVSLLKQEDAPPYVIMTNGKLWRLYAKKAHSQALNYYEIDLEETLASPDRAEAIRYFWFFFRMVSFVPEEEVREGETRWLSFLDQVMEGSDAYAKELGDRLKECVFEEVFPNFARGFIEQIRSSEGKDADLNQERLDGVYQGTLTFLYRLMFLLYAEARDLLPVKEVRGYWEASLERLKGEIEGLRTIFWITLKAS